MCLPPSEAAMGRKERHYVTESLNEFRPVNNVFGCQSFALCAGFNIDLLVACFEICRTI